MDTRVRNVLVAVLVVTVCVVALSFMKSPEIKETDVFNVPQIAVHIKGAVTAPGYYELDAASRVIDVIDVAGGALENANIDAINLAQFLEDGSEVVIPVKNEAALEQGEYSLEEKININTANEQQLCTLDGIGSVTAKKIIDYRQQYGNFAVKEEIMNVSGIGEKKFENIKDSICVD